MVDALSLPQKMVDCLLPSTGHIKSLVSSYRILSYQNAIREQIVVLVFRRHSKVTITRRVSLVPRSKLPVFTMICDGNIPGG